MKRFCPQCGLLYEAGHRICPLDGSPLVARDDPFLGRILAGKYRIICLIGEGGNGRVYRARHVHMDRQVAVKVLPEDASAEVETKERFIREARAADMVRHENIVEILDLGETREGIPFMIMELLEGIGLEILIGKRAFPVHRAVHVMRQICSVLGPTHAMGIIHRDLKPENVFLIERNERPDFVKVLDFGVAHLAHEPGITREGMVLGTPHYMAPELAMGHRPTAATDLYALGCIGYEMIAGHPPFHKGSVFEIMTQHIQQAPEALRAIVPDVPLAFEAIILRLLQKVPEERYMDAYAVLRDLDAFMPPVQPPPDPALRLSTPGFYPGTPLSTPGHTMTPDMLASWRRFTEAAKAKATPGDRRLVYEIEELTGKLESIFGMMEDVLTVMSATEEKSRWTGRHIRFSIDRLASGLSLRRAALEASPGTGRPTPEIEELGAQILEFRRQLETLTVETADLLAGQQGRMLALEADREEVEAKLCELSMRIGAGTS